MRKNRDPWGLAVGTADAILLAAERPRPTVEASAKIQGAAQLANELLSLHRFRRRKRVLAIAEAFWRMDKAADRRPVA